MSILVYRPIADHVHVKNTTARYINTTAPCRKEWHRNLSDILIIHLHREPDFQDRRGAASLRYRPASKSLFLRVNNLRPVRCGFRARATLRTS